MFIQNACYFIFQHILLIWTLSNNDYDFEIHIFIHNYNKRLKCSLMLQRETRCIKSQRCKPLNRMKMCTFLLFCLNIIFSTALQMLQKRVTCFPEDKISYIYPDLQVQKVFTSRLLIYHVSFWSIREHLNLLYLHMSPPVILCVKRWISKSYSHCWKGFKYTKMLENQRICGTWRIFLKKSRKFNCSAQTRDSWTTITKQKKHSCGSFR